MRENYIKRLKRKLILDRSRSYKNENNKLEGVERTLGHYF